MIRVKQALIAVRERLAQLVPTRNTRRVSARADFYQQPPHSIESTHSPVSSQDNAFALAPASSNSTLNTDQHTASIPLTTIHKVPATPTIVTNAAHVCNFSHGSGLLVYINGALISAALVALKVNIATLEFVKRLPLDELGGIGACLGAAFANDGSYVDITWAEVGSETEQDWRDAERDWEPFPGGPYEVFELEEYDESVPRRSVHRFQSGKHGKLDAEAFSRRHLPVPSDGALCSRLRDSSASPQRSATATLSGAGDTGTQGLPVMTNADFSALSDYSKSFGCTSSPCGNQDAIELAALKRPTTLREAFADLYSEKENTLNLWSPGKGDGPIMSDDDFNALPEWTDVEYDLDWNSATRIEGSEVRLRAAFDD